MTDDAPYRVTMDDMISEVRRECSMRRRVYETRIREKRMNHREAAMRIATMDAVLLYLEDHRDGA